MSTDMSIVTEALDRFPTPFFLFDEAELKAQAEHLRSLLPQSTALCYAMKANSFVLAAAARVVERIEVCSPGEARTCFALGIPDENLVISGVYKEAAFIRELMEEHPQMGYYTVESCAQFDLLTQTAQQVGRPIRILMRLTSGNQFGITARELKELARRCTDLALVDFCGIQFYSGTQKTSLKRLKRELERINRLVDELQEEGIAVRELEFGPGFPVSYYVPDEEARAEQDTLTRGLADLLEELPFTGAVTLELGRSLVASCGTYVTSVVDTKHNKTGNYAIVDGGKHQFVYFGNALSLQLPPCTVLPETREGEHEIWNVCGSLCTVNDILVKQMETCGLKVGDALAFSRAGAYCMTEGISLFLSRDLPRVVLRSEEGTLRLARDRIETFELNTPHP